MMKAPDVLLMGGLQRLSVVLAETHDAKSNPYQGGRKEANEKHHRF
ncbi:MAG: hypothetical protein ACO3SO_12055 [Luteolibacter sp.]